MFFLWDGKGEVWELNPKTWALVGLFPTGGSPVENANGGFFTGVLGDWHYLAGLGVFAGVTRDYVNGVFTPRVWLYDPGTSGSPQNRLVGSAVGDELASTLGDPTSVGIAEPGMVGVLLFGAGFALLQYRRQLKEIHSRLRRPA
jgi:hypothetical protein